MDKIRELQRRAATMVAEAETIWKSLPASNDDPVKLARFDTISKEIEEVRSQIATHEQREAAMSRMLELRAARQDMDPNAKSDLPHNQTSHRYSMLRAIRQMIKRDAVDGLEGEVSAEIAKRQGMSPQGFWMPTDLETPNLRDRRNQEKRAITASSAAGALDVNVLHDRFIDILRNKMLMASLGAQMLDDLVGTVRIPKQTATSNAYWVAAGSEIPTASNPTIGQIQANLLQLGAYLEWDRSLINQTSIAVEAWARADLARVKAIEYDRACFNGLGSSGQPLGLLQNSGIPVVALGTNGAVPTWDHMVSLEETIDDGNALEVGGKIAFVTSPKGRGKLKRTVLAGNTAAEMLWDRKEKTVNSYPAYSSRQIPSNLTKGSGTNLSAAILGDFSMCLMCQWGGLDVTVNPYSLDKSNSYRITAFSYLDFLVRYTEAFAKIVDMITA